MLALGWLLFLALYTICLVHVIVRDMASYGATIPIGWRWRWKLLAAPFLMLSEAWDDRGTAWRAFRR